MKSWKRSVLKFVLGSLTLLLVVYAILALVCGSRLRAAHRALEEAGRPMHGEEVIPDLVEDSDNAALLYQSAYLQLMAESFGEGGLLDALSELRSALHDEGLSEADWATVQDILGRPDVQWSLALVKKGGQRPACRFDMEYDRGFETLLPHLAPVRGLSNLLALQAEMAAKAGEAETAWQAVVTGLQLADALRQEPTLISQLVRLAQFGMATETMRRVAALAPPSSGQAGAADQALAPFGDRDPMVRALDGERLLGGESIFDHVDPDLFSMLGSLEGGSSDHPPSRLLASPLFALFQPVMAADQAAYNRIMLSYVDQLENMGDSTGTASEKDLLDEVPFYCLVTRLITPSLGAIHKKQMKHEALVHILRTGLAVAAMKAETGAYPPALKDLGDRLPKGVGIDPATGAPLGYTTGPDGTRVFIEDGQDDSPHWQLDP